MWVQRPSTVVSPRDRYPVKSLISAALQEAAKKSNLLTLTAKSKEFAACLPEGWSSFCFGLLPLLLSIGKYSYSAWLLITQRCQERSTQQLLSLLTFSNKSWHSAVDNRFEQGIRPENGFANYSLSVIWVAKKRPHSVEDATACSLTTACLSVAATA